MTELLNSKNEQSISCRSIIRNCVISDIVVTDSRVGMVIELPDHSSPTDFGENPTRVENIHFSNIVFDRIEESPLKVIVYPDNLYGKIKNIRFSNITSTSGDYPLVKGRADAVLEEIYFDNCKFMVDRKKGGEKPLSFFEYVKGLHLNNTTFDIATLEDII